MSLSNRKRARVLAINIESDIQSTIRIPPLESTEYIESMKNWAIDIGEIRKLLRKKPKKKRKLVENTISKSSAIHVVPLKSLPAVTSVEAMRACLTVLADDLDLGPLTYHNYHLMNNGTYCYNISGKCPIHKVIHDGGAKRWQIHQKRGVTSSAIKCWKGGYEKRFQTCLL